MPEFVFMLTHDDFTVEDAFKVYDEVRDTSLHFIGFKDVGLPFDRLKALTEAMHEDGREVMLEVVRGLDLLAYRQDGDVERLVRSVVASVEVPVIAAGSVDSEVKIRTLADEGVWGFTVGSAIFEGKFAHDGASTREQVEAVLRASRPVAS